MVRKILLVALMAAVVAPMIPGQAKVLKRKNVTFEASVPCTVVCPYWLNPEAFSAGATAFVEKAPNFDPSEDDAEAFADRAADVGLSVLGKTDWGCDYPGPDVSWDQVKVKAPRGATLLVFEIFPETDWDSFICNAKGKFIASGANTVGDCDLGCSEKVAIKVKPGRRYILRAFNWSDFANLRGRYTFHKI